MVNVVEIIEKDYVDKELNCKKPDSNMTVWEFLHHGN